MWVGLSSLVLQTKNPWTEWFYWIEFRILDQICSPFDAKPHARSHIHTKHLYSLTSLSPLHLPPSLPPFPLIVWVWTLLVTLLGTVRTWSSIKAGQGINCSKTEQAGFWKLVIWACRRCREAVSIGPSFTTVFFLLLYNVENVSQYNPVNQKNILEAWRESLKAHFSFCCRLWGHFHFLCRLNLSDSRRMTWSSLSYLIYPFVVKEKSSSLTILTSKEHPDVREAST